MSRGGRGVVVLDGNHLLGLLILKNRNRLVKIYYACVYSIHAARTILSTYLN